MTEAIATIPVVEETKQAEPITSSASPTPSPPSEYYAMVVDSGPIIKQDVRNLMGKAQTYVTTPSVLREIRDSRARDYLEQQVLPLLDLKLRQPTESAIQDVIAFAKQTGDYASLSTVDLQVLALTLDLEREGCLVSGNNPNNLDHIRKTPKRKIGLGSILPMNNKTSNISNKSSKAASPAAAAASQEEKKGEDNDDDNDKDNEALDGTSEEKQSNLLGREDYDEVEESDDDDEDDVEEKESSGHERLGSDEEQPQQQNLLKNNTVELPAKLSEMRLKTEAELGLSTEAITSPSTASEPVATSTLPAYPKPPAKKSWATLVNPTVASTMHPQDPTPVVHLVKTTRKPTTESAGGQFDDASEDEDEQELQQEFPSLLAASTVPFEGEDDEIDARGDIEERKVTKENPHQKTKASVFMTEEEKQQNLKPISKSGRNYNSFRKYKGLMKPKQTKNKSESGEDEDVPQLVYDETATSTTQSTQQQQTSRFLSGGGGGETMHEEDDDGQGWITSSDDIKFMKNEAGGVLDPGKPGTIGGQNNTNTNQTKKASGPHMSQRTACATTDFAMQNVLLQMNMILLSTEGMRIRRLKSWVIRCGACFKIHGAAEDFRDGTNHHMKRLFCSHCGSDMMQRISASVDGKTGRLKLHFSRRKQGRHHSIRGTKFALPKPGTGNKYKGDLLLREDQLLSGAWNQKVKINSGRKYQNSKSQSMFGRDIASSVGCNVKSTSSASFGGKGWSSTSNTSSGGGFGTSTDDIRVGFGARKNPNAARGRERRGKKKKSSDRACGMHRY